MDGAGDWWQSASETESDSEGRHECLGLGEVGTKHHTPGRAPIAGPGPEEGAGVFGLEAGAHGAWMRVRMSETDRHWVLSVNRTFSLAAKTFWHTYDALAAAGSMLYVEYDRIFSEGGSMCCPRQFASSMLS
jgi:hypothetical protein